MFSYFSCFLSYIHIFGYAAKAILYLVLVLIPQESKKGETRGKRRSENI
jgi:hypothetical protein